MLESHTPTFIIEPKLICILTAVAMLSVSGCSLTVAQDGFVKIENIFSYGGYVSSVDICGDIGLIFCIGYDTDSTMNFRITTFNLKKGKALKDKIIEGIDTTDAEYECEFTSDGNIAICNVWEDTADIYNYNLQYISSTDYVYYDENYNEENNVTNVADDTFSWYGGYASHSIGENEVLVFNSDDENSYIRKLSTDSVETYFKDKIMLSCSQKDNMLYFSIDDYESLNSINSAQINLSESSGESESDRIPYCVGISDTYVLAPIMADTGNLEDVYCWNYTLNQKSSPLEAVAYTNEEFEKVSQELESDIEKKYDVNITINPEEDLDSDKPLIKEKIPSKIYLSLLMIDNAFSLFPQEMFSEMLEGNFTSYDVYLCSYIDDNFSAAYSTNWNGSVYIVLSSNSMTLTTIAHEVFHSAEYRIWNYYSEFDDEWLKLNPDDFEYEGYDSDAEIDYEVSDKYFARAYGRSDILEDQAVTFEALFCYSADDYEIAWEKDSYIYEKGKLICKALRKAYPSVRNSDSVIWEDYYSDDNITFA